jgi:hypothetical protein
MEGIIMSNLAKHQGDQVQYQSEVKATNEAFRRHTEKAILVSPATQVASIPEGTEVAFSHFFVDTNKDSGEVYDVGGNKYGLSRVVLDKIAAQAGVSWDPNMSRRLDDGSDPHYCVYHAVGKYRQFDGSEVQIQGTKEMDLREGSAQYEALVERYESKLAYWEKSGRKGYPPKDPRSGQIREMRLHILAHAESKARLRAIRSMGIKSSYTLQELEKPFVVARLMWTGRTNDPELRRLAFQMRANQMMGAGAAMYGAPPAAMPALAPAAPMGPALPAAVQPPPVGGGLDEDDVGYEDHTSHRAEPPEPEPPYGQPEPEPAPNAPSVPDDDYGPRPAPSRGSSPRNAVGNGEPFIEFGKNEGTPLTQLNDQQIAWYLGMYEKEIKDPSKEKWHDTTRRRLNEMQAEKARRAG